MRDGNLDLIVFLFCSWPDMRLAGLPPAPSGPLYAFISLSVSHTGSLLPFMLCSPSFGLVAFCPSARSSCLAAFCVFFVEVCWGIVAGVLNATLSYFPFLCVSVLFVSSHCYFYVYPSTRFANHSCLGRFVVLRCGSTVVLHKRPSLVQILAPAQAFFI